MTVKRRMILFISLFIIAIPQIADAQTVPIYSWIWKVDFATNRPRALLILHEKFAGTVTREHIVDFSNTCEPVGTVTVQNGRAYFDGKGYFRCKLPDILKQIEHYFGVHPSLTPISTHVWASAELIGSTSGPLFVYETMIFDALFESEFASSTLTLNGTPYQQVYQVQDNRAPGQKRLLWVGHQLDELLNYVWFHPTPGAWSQSYRQLPQVPSGSFPPQYLLYVDNGSWQATNQQIVAFPLTTSETSLYIGFNPATAEFLQGAISEVSADPGIRGP